MTRQDCAGRERLLRYCALERLRKADAEWVYRCAKQHSKPGTVKRGAKADELCAMRFVRIRDPLRQVKTALSLRNVMWNACATRRMVETAARQSTRPKFVYLCSNKGWHFPAKGLS